MGAGGSGRAVGKREIIGNRYVVDRCRKSSRCPRANRIGKGSKAWERYLVEQHTYIIVGAIGCYQIKVAIPVHITQYTTAGASTYFGAGVEGVAGKTAGSIVEQHTGDVSVIVVTNRNHIKVSVSVHIPQCYRAGRMTHLGAGSSKVRSEVTYPVVEQHIHGVDIGIGRNHIKVAIAIYIPQS